MSTRFPLFLASLFLALVSMNGAERLPVLRITYQGTLVYESYTPGTMELDDGEGNTVQLPARFKTRGATALSYAMKPSLNMKLEDAEGNEIDENLLGLRKASSFILDAMAIDRICMRNRVCFDIWNDFSKLPYETDFDSRNGTVGKFVTVYMNGEYKGIYCLSDKINRKLLALKKPKVADNGDVTIRGVLYKNGTNDIADINTPGFFNNYSVYVGLWHDAWELHEPDDYPGEDAWAPLVDYYADNNFTRNSYIAAHFYTENLVDYSLFIMALCIADNWGTKNKYFSMVNCNGSADESRFIVTPWDLDTSLGGDWNGTKFNGDYNDWSPQQIAANPPHPFALCFSDNTVKALMRDRWIATRGTVFSVQSVAARLYDYCELFENTGAWDEYVRFWNARGDKPKYVDDLRGEIDGIVQWYAERHRQLDQYFNVTETDGIDDISSDPSPADAPVYDLQGRAVQSSRLQPGHVYISGGRKFIHSR